MQKKPPAKKKIVHGDDLLYRFFQQILMSEPQLFAKIPRLMLGAMAIWLPLTVYEDWPILLPWVVRDRTCRGNPRKGEPDRWSAPDELGYLRDDNSLIKNLPRSLPVRGPKGSHIQGARMGSEFVACHVWRVVNHPQLASRIPDLNSFVPNLVWLPSQVAKLTDREAGVVQATLQAMSLEIYRKAPVAPHLRDVVEAAWNLIPEPASLASVVLDELNWFETTPYFLATRQSRLNSVIRALELIEQGKEVPFKVISTRYTEGLPTIPPTQRQLLLKRLRQFVAPQLSC